MAVVLKGIRLCPQRSCLGSVSRTGNVALEGNVRSIRLRCRGALSLGMALALGAPTHAQVQPRFRSGVELTSVNVTVVDDRGRPIRDLAPVEFTILVDGQSRRVVSAEWITARPVAGRGITPPSNRSSSLTTVGTDRRLVIVIDQPNLRFGGAIGHRASINKFIDRLPPTVRVSVVNLGVGAKSIAFTTDRNRAKQIIAAAVGGVPYPPSTKTAGELTFDTLRALMKDLEVFEGPKTMVLVSQGLPFEADARPSFAELERVAASARTTIYALRLDDRVSITQREPDSQKDPSTSIGLLSPDPSNGVPDGQGRGTSRLPDSPLPVGPVGDRGAEGMEAAGELAAVAAATGGTMFTVSMNADSALARIESESSGYYLLGLESVRSDRDGIPHSLHVDVSRARVTVRAARYLPTR